MIKLKGVQKILELSKLKKAQELRTLVQELAKKYMPQ